ncbi:hypothetical protein [Piscinibacter sp.]|uniref:hypothetical protein n=1 Tax=Piscinibacter sp. TaxID=1903157 RepID=UPI0039E44FA4
MSVLNRPRIEAYIGASGSGKGVSVNARLRELTPRRLLIWDPRNEYDAYARAVHSLPELVKAFQKAGAGGVRVRYVPGAALKLDDAFDVVCKLAFNAGELVFVAEELSDVTTASRAPASWRQVITQGRHRALHVLGCAQRPALIDKTFLGNATYIRCFTLRYDDDRRAMAKALDVPQAQVDALETVETEKHTTIRYIERDFRAKVLRTAQIRLAR